MFALSLAYPQGGLLVKIIRTTNEPHKIHEVDDAEYIDLERMGFIAEVLGDEDIPVEKPKAPKPTDLQENKGNE